MVKSSKARRFILGVTAVVFAAIAVGSLIAPRTMAEGLGYSLDNVDALSEFRAIYVGLWLAHVVLLVVAFRRIHDAILGDLCAVLILGQVVGRIISLAIDGPPSARIWPVFILEAIGGILLLIIRSEEPASGPASTRGGRG